MKLIFKPPDGAKQLALHNMVKLCILEATYSGCYSSPFTKGPEKLLVPFEVNPEQAKTLPLAQDAIEAALPLGPADPISDA